MSVPDPLPLRNIPVPPEITRVEGCDCGGMTFHRAPDRGYPGCSLLALPVDRQRAAIAAAEDREAAWNDELNRKLRAVARRSEGGNQ